MPLDARKVEKIFSYKDYVEWDGRWELINGIAYNMSPAPSRRHQQISRELEMQIANYLKDKSCEIYYAPFDVFFPEENERDEDIKTIVQPDLVVICDLEKLNNKGCRGAPDIVIEILSPNTASKDMKEKLLLYEKHKVKEYWIVHPTDNTVLVFKLLNDENYGRPEIYIIEDKIKTPILKELEIDLSIVFKK